MFSIYFQRRRSSTREDSHPQPAAQGRMERTKDQVLARQLSEFQTCGILCTHEVPVDWNVQPYKLHRDNWCTTSYCDSKQHVHQSHHLAELLHSLKYGIWWFWCKRKLNTLWWKNYSTLNIVGISSGLVRFSMYFSTGKWSLHPKKCLLVKLYNMKITTAKCILKKWYILNH